MERYLNHPVGWLTRFKHQYGIHETAAQGERLSASDAAVGCYIWHILCMVFCEFRNAGLRRKLLPIKKMIILKINVSCVQKSRVICLVL
jgi:hypothetical protein